ncbi:poly(A) RNA polymerase, mitochondrial-like [Oppia nitens]|uniref:poly(A) RNA polymerase, mitochondrial-like n=1 Tax=Oppia nitens TaxID=1686743 RepID=UPI0023D996C2|nr:poly(A) RNA polymerase, mitochondrial-like [Oppia nitens]
MLATIVGQHAKQSAALLRQSLNIVCGHKYLATNSSVGSVPNEKLSEFESIIAAEKLKANNYLLIEDKCDVLSRLTPATLSQLLETRVDRVHKWQFSQNNCALVELYDPDYRLNRYILRNFGITTDKKQPPKYNLKFLSLNSCPKLLLPTNRHSTAANNSGQRSEVIRELTSRRRDAYYLNASFMKQSFKTNDEIMKYLVSDKDFDDLDLKLRFYIISQLEQYICQSYFKSYHILPFGSSIAGLGTPNSDLDLVLTPRQVSDPTQSSREDDRQRLKSNLNLIADLLQYSIPYYSHFSRILSARVPIVKFGFDLAPIDIDLSIELSPHSVHSGVYMSAFLNYCIRLNPCVRDLILFLRLWAKQHKLLKPKNWSTHLIYNGFTSFQLTSLVIYFLQIQNILPPMSHFMQPSGQPFITNKQNTDTLDLLAKFFEFVLSISYQWEAISILNARTYGNPDQQLPIWMENPFQTELNMCRNITHEKFERFLVIAQLSAQIMTSTDGYSLADILDKELYMSSLANGAKLCSRIAVKDLFNE